jgi:antitoxin MazE
MGNSHGVIIPKPLLAEIGVKPGDEVDLKVKGRNIVMTLPRRAARKGWAEDSRRLAAAGEGGLAWPEFASDADKDLKW